MKRSHLLLLSLFLIISLQVGASALASKRDSIELTGLIYNNQDHVKDVVINIYHHNKLWKTEKLGRSNRLRTYLPKNSVLTIEICAPDHHTKRFMFNTTVPTNLKVLPKYRFDIDLFTEEEISGVNSSILDFPVGLVEYDEKKKVFLRNKKYTKKMKKAYLKLWEEAQMMVERSGIESKDE